MESYQINSSLSSGGYSDTSVRENGDTTAPRNPFAYEVVPPIGRLLDCVRAHIGVGGSFRPGNRQLADWLGYASASPIPALLCQLACLDWIRYDATSGVIMLLRDYGDDRSIDLIDRSDRDDSALIDRIDRDAAHLDAETESDRSDRSNPQCMEDHDLVAAALDSESAAARSKIPCSAESIDPPDHRALLLAELGADAKIIRDALRARPDVTTEQIRASWAHFEQRISAGLCTAGAFFNAIKRGQLHTAPPDPQQPLDPEAYRDRPGFALGGAPPGPPEVESIGDIARRILPADASGPDWIYVQTRLARGDTETGALASLSTRRKGVRR